MNRDGRAKRAKAADTVGLYGFALKTNAML